MHKELQQRVASEFRYVATKMQESKDGAKKLFYFSAIFGEASRILNFEWDRDLVLIHAVTNQAYAQITASTQNPAMLSLPIDWETVYKVLTEAASDLADYYEKANDKKEMLCQIMGRIAEAAYLAGGNGSYLYEKGVIKL